MLPTIRTLIHESLQQSYKGSHNEVFKGEMGEGGARVWSWCISCNNIPYTSSPPQPFPLAKIVTQCKGIFHLCRVGSSAK